MTESPTSISIEQPSQRSWVHSLLLGIGLCVFNLLLYKFLPRSLLNNLGNWGYLGAFLVAAIANASVVVPVPYYPLVARLGQAFDPWGIVGAAAAGSALGEMVAFWVGRTGRSVVENKPFYHWLQKELKHPWRSGIVLFLLAAPPNPAFDVAGLLAGAIGLSPWTFFFTVFFGRIIRMGIVVFGMPTILNWFGLS